MEEFRLVLSECNTFGKPWVGTRCLINLNLKAKVLEHFVKHDMKYYDNFMKMGCPNGTFVSF